MIRAILDFLAPRSTSTAPRRVRWVLLSFVTYIFLALYTYGYNAGHHPQVVWYNVSCHDKVIGDYDCQKTTGEENEAATFGVSLVSGAFWWLYWPWELQLLAKKA